MSHDGVQPVESGSVALVRAAVQPLEDQPVAPEDQRALAVSRHAIRRWQQRVNDVHPASAEAEIAAFLRGAHPSRRPRRWMDLEGLAEGRDRYWLNPDRPDLVVVARGGEAVTVLARHATRRRPRRLRDSRPVLRSTP